MHHPDLAQSAAVLGAVGCVLALFARRRLELYAGLALLAAAEAMLAVSLVPTHDLSRLKTPLHVAAVVFAVLVVVAGAAGFVRWPALVPLAVLVTAPFRIQVGLGSLQDKFLLLPLYAVLAAAVLALVYRTARPASTGSVPIRPLTPLLALPVAAFMAFDALSLLWAEDLEAGSVELAFFIFPFAALVVVVARSPYASWLPRALGTAAVALGCVFAAIGLYQAYTHTLIYAHDLSVANAYTTYFRVTSLFKDPSIYGRQLVVSATLALAFMWSRKLGFWWAAAITALLYAGLYFSYSQSSMVVLFAGALVVTIALADRPSRNVIVIAALVAALAAAAGFVASAKGNSWHKATSGRSHLISVTATVIKNHPLAGVGIGSQPFASQQEVRSKLVARKDASHTTPLTVLAELGVFGFLLYLALIACGAVLLQRVIRRDRLLGICLGVIFLVLLLHSFVYSGFFEDPLTWGILAFAAAALTGLGPVQVPPEVREET